MEREKLQEREVFESCPSGEVEDQGNPFPTEKERKRGWVGRQSSSKAEPCSNTRIEGGPAKKVSSLI